MKKTFILFVLCFFGFGLFAQPDHGKRYNKERIEKLRTNYIKEKLELSENETKEFWPVYEQYCAELKSIQGDDETFHHLKTSVNQIKKLSDEEAKQLVEKQMEKERRFSEVRQKYFKEFKQVLPIKKVAILFQAEMEFRKKLFQRLAKKRMMDREKRKSKRSE